MPDPNAFLPKARELFLNRHIHWLLQLADGAGRPVQADVLLDLQARIYALDDLLESCWEPDPEDLHLLWQGIREATALGDFPEQERELLLRGLAEYQQQELSVRRGERLCDIPIADFYYRKTCDVRLARDLIYRKAPELDQHVPRTAWEALDRLTEVEDDLTDREEDRRTFNGNRFLSSLQHRTLTDVVGEYEAYARSLTVTGDGTEPLDSWMAEALGRVLALLYSVRA